MTRIFETLRLTMICRLGFLLAAILTCTYVMASALPTRTATIRATSGTGIVGDVMADSSSVRCATDTRDVGVHDGYNQGTRVTIRLCALPNLPSTSPESTPGSRYYISGANGKGLVNSQVSRNVFEMVKAAKNAHISLRAFSTFRTMAHQQALCNANALCKKGNYTYVAQPGYSLHQMGFAIDFAGTNVEGGKTCKTRATDKNSPIWNWLYIHARTFDEGQYSVESWHWEWDKLKIPNRCY